MYTEKYHLTTYRDERGLHPVEDFVEGLPEKAQRKIHSWLDLLIARGPALPRPYAGYLDDGVRELRVSFSHLEIRLLYFIEGSTIVLTQGFLKRTRQVPEAEISLCKRRRERWRERREEER